MKIVFLCGSLESGKDGVGDYTRHLSREMARIKHQVLLIAINDRFVDSLTTNVELLDEGRIPCLRLSSNLSSRQRFQYIEKEIKKFDPEWVSLQFVPYSFQKKGLPWSLSKKLNFLGENVKWHIMFHELWLGINKDSSIKHRIIGKLQEIIVVKMVNALRPKVIHTQSSVYMEALKKKGISATILPLFSNIPKRGSKIEKTDKNQLTFVVFGSIQPQAPFAEFLEELNSHQTLEKKKFRFIFIGRSGAELENWTSVCKEKDVDTVVLGEQNSHKISQVLFEADWGVSSTPFYQSEKSGTIAAMLDHQLPVYCVARSWNPPSTKNLALPEQVRKYTRNQLNLKQIPLVDYKNDVAKVTTQFYESLTMC